MLKAIVKNAETLDRFLKKYFERSEIFQPYHSHEIRSFKRRKKN